MSNILKIFKSDLKALKRNVVSVMLTVGLVLMPSMFVWYNVLASWDVFGNTVNLNVAIANTDKGYKSDLIPMELNLGNQVVDALRDNEQMSWVFTSKEDAIDGASSGKYYAALVIPESFSQEMLTFYTSGVEGSPILYYSNEKKSAIAPKVTSQGADQISYQVNRIFVKTISEVVLNVMKDIVKVSDDDSVSSRIDTLIDRIGEASDNISQHSQTLCSYLEVVQASKDLINSTSALVEDTKDSIDEVYSSVEGTSEDAISLIGALEQTSEALSQALSQSVKNYDATKTAIDSAFLSSQTTAKDSSKALREEANNLESQAQATEKLIEALKAVEDKVPANYKQVFEQFILLLENSVEMQKQSVKALNEAADNIDSGSKNLEESQKITQEKVDDAVSSLKSVESSYQSDLKPKLDELSTITGQVADSLSSNSKKLDEIGEMLGDEIKGTDSKIDEASKAIQEAVDNTKEASQSLSNIYERLVEARDSGGVGEVKEVLGDNPSLLADALSAPIGIKRIAEFPVANFGSAMSPLYASLGLWVGCLLTVVLIKTNPNEQTLKKCKRKPHLHEIFLGRFGVFALIALLQATVIAFGNLVFLGIEATNPFLYMLCFWLSALVFEFIMYTLVASFGNVGKAIAVLLLIVQVTGSGGSFPIQLLPDYASIVNPFLPATYVVGSMRSSMLGIYQGDYWIYLGKLLLFIVPMALIGLVLRRPFIRLNEKFVERVEKSKLI